MSFSKNTPKSKSQYHTSCVNSDGESITDMVDRARDISYETFMRQCDCADLVENMGYATGREVGLHLKDDWHVSYHKSTFQGMPCYYMRHSAIEYVFIRPEDMNAKKSPRMSRASGYSDSAPAFG